MIDDEQRRLHGKRSLRLVMTTLIVFVVLVLIMPLIASGLNGYSFARFPLGLLIISHGTVIGIIAVIYWASGRQDTLDRRHGMTSEF